MKYSSFYPTINKPENEDKMESSPSYETYEK